jgi:hypothetical protein
MWTKEQRRIYRREGDGYRADADYNARQVDAAVAKVPVLRMEIVKRRDDMKSFVVLPRRWVVSAPFPGSAAIGVSPRTSRTSPKP